MGADSKIEWTDHTFNPWWGCTKVSQGCKNCYAETLSDRFGHDCWGPTSPRRPMTEKYWKQPLKWNHDAWKEGVQRRVFCASMADVFEGDDTMPEESRSMVREARARLFNLIHDTPSLDWLLLTKRPQNAGEMYRDWLENTCGSDRYEDDRFEHEFGWLNNIWIGTSVEDQATADERIPHLLRIPSKVRFLSMEPLLGAVDLSYWLDFDRENDCKCGDGECHECWQSPTCRTPNWVIVGGESGHGARPMHPDWVRALRDQCNQAGVPFFFKQWGDWAPDGVATPFPTFDGPNLVMKPGFALFVREGIPLKRVGKKRAGRVLDGRTWDEFPDVGC